ncbi:MAG TPA: YqjK family protein [Burkholderiales bacterium]|nr:YqjK family protein [Burkholderiales bacterium]
MKKTLAAVAAKRQELVSRAAAQRAELALLVEPWRGPLLVADKAYRFALVLRRYPAISTLVLAMLIPAQRHRVLKWGGPLLAFWELYQTFREPRPRRAEKAEA